MANIGIIPVRGGSSGVAGKNMRIVAGRPLLWYAVESARAAESLHRVYVSTEDAGLADYAESIGVDVIRHPAELSLEHSPTYPVIRWDLEYLRRELEEPSIIAVLRATTPLRMAVDIDEAVSLLQRSPGADSVVSVVEAIGVHPIRLKRVLASGGLVDAFEPEGNFPRRRQEFEKLFLRNGAVYASRPAVIDAGGLWGPNCLAYVMPEERSLNINSEHQLRVADLLLRSLDR
jgi:CMP-N,N'-diacetyllegionaminic acid synthase